MPVDLDRIPTYFAEWIAANGEAGPTGEVARWLASGELEPEKFSEVVTRHGSGNELWFRKNMLDLVLGYARRRLSDGCLGIDDIQDIRALKRALHVHEGDFFRYRPVELSAFLQHSLEVMLLDYQLDDDEELHLAGVQAAFDLSYDEVFALARPAIERTVAELDGRIVNAYGAERERLAAMRSGLEPVYQLAGRQSRSLGALY